MKRLFLTLSFVLFGLIVFSQNDSNPLLDVNQKRIKKTKTGMLILGSWAIGNIALSPVLAGRATGSDKYFHQMNAYWNVINLGIAGLGYYGLMKEDPSLLGYSESILAQQKIEKLLLFNTALDAAYMLGGLYMMEKSKTISRNADRLKGFGKSVILQGGFLMAFDLIFFLTINKHGEKLYQLLDKLQISPTSVGLTLRF